MNYCDSVYKPCKTLLEQQFYKSAMYNCLICLFYVTFMKSYSLYISRNHGKQVGREMGRLADDKTQIDFKEELITKERR